MLNVLKHELENIFRYNVPIIMFTDNLSLFDVFEKGNTTAENCLTIDLNLPKMRTTTRKWRKLDSFDPIITPQTLLLRYIVVICYSKSYVLIV